LTINGVICNLVYKYITSPPHLHFYVIKKHYPGEFVPARSLSVFSLHLFWNRTYGDNRPRFPMNHMTKFCHSTNSVTNH